MLLQHPRVQDFISYLRLRNLSSGTVEHYEKVLRDLLRHLGSEIESPAQITAAHLRQYVTDLQARGLAAKTINDRVTILKRFFGFLLVEGHITEDPAARLPTPKVGKRLPKALSLEETQTLLAALDQDISTVGQRDKVLFHLLYACGLRVAEAVALRVEDIDFAEGFLRVVGKGDKERRVYLKPALVELLRDYVDSRQLSGYLFPGKDADHLETRSVRYRLTHYASKAGLKRRISPHTLRHSIAVHYLQGGAPVSFVQGLFGHASLATTGVYLQLTDQMTKDITLKTETALERLVEKEKELRLEEPRRVYAVGVEDWDAYVAEVLEWLTPGSW